MRQRRQQAVVGGLVVVIGAGCVAAPAHHGPLPVRNQHPAQLTVQSALPRSADVVPARSAELRHDAAYTSLWLLGTGPGASSWSMDGEYLRSSTRATVGLGHGLDLGVELAFAHTTGGFLDQFIIDYHDVFDLPDQDRSGAPKDQFLIEATRGGQTAFAVDEASFALLDVPLVLTWQIAAPGRERLGAALRAGVELPTGDDDRGFGNGGLDALVGGIVDYRTDHVGWTAWAQHTFAATPSRARRAGVGFADVTQIGAAAELPLTAELAAVVQLGYETSTLRRLGPEVAANDQLLLWVGARYVAASDWAVELGFGEDLFGKASPDFTAWLGVVWRPGMGAQAASPR
jgi:hypothetical protein